MKMYLLSTNEIELLPSTEDVEFYREHGWFISKKLFDDEEIDLLKRESEAFYTGTRDRCLPLRPKRVAYWEPSHGDSFRINDYIIYESQKIESILTKPLIGAVAALLCGEDVRVFNTSLMYKPPKLGGGKSTVGWHTDRAYWRTCTSDDMLTAWVPLHDTDEDIGTISMMDRSHHWLEKNQSNATNSRHFIRSDLGELNNQVLEDAESQQVNKVPMILNKGHISFHHCKTYHGSGDNISDRPRWALSLHIQNVQNRYRKFKFANGSLATYNSDELCRKDAHGDPDYTDPEFFPPLWVGGDPRNSSVIELQNRELRVQPSSQPA